MGVESFFPVPSADDEMEEVLERDFVAEERERVDAILELNDKDESRWRLIAPGSEEYKFYNSEQTDLNFTFYDAGAYLVRKYTNGRRKELIEKINLPFRW